MYRIELQFGRVCLAIYAYNHEEYTTRIKLLDGRIRVTASKLPAFMYIGFEPAEQYNPNAIHEGLLKGYYVPRVYRHIFTGPGTALKDQTSKTSRSTRAHNAKIHGLSCATPKTTSYAIIQHALTSQESWPSDGMDKHFNYKDFYDRINTLLEDPTDPWAKDVAYLQFNTIYPAGEFRNTPRLVGSALTPPPSSPAQGFSDNLGEPACMDKYECGPSKYIQALLGLGAGWRDAYYQSLLTMVKKACEGHESLKPAARKLIKHTAMIKQVNSDPSDLSSLSDNKAPALKKQKRKGKEVAVIAGDSNAKFGLVRMSGLNKPTDTTTTTSQKKKKAPKCIWTESDTKKLVELAEEHVGLLGEGGGFKPQFYKLAEGILAPLTTKGAAKTADVDDENCYSTELVYGLCLLEQWSGLVVCGVLKLCKKNEKEREEMNVVQDKIAKKRKRKG
ncbi:hypothetical protein SERLA73DRAFT_160816 [Serpula lacrymans var. lacrymans S7.3]|uniref:Uncharacterized protein n=1 Tax=Serpula lacrymans var. lacrymans (strain S7.3) TaxID=936435 RepID=F8PXD2_SERL3|nr:hypothetical protein SERLA73DRAFT_160816 [Serpula lacrymans var. lacrymans S7.3]